MMMIERKREKHVNINHLSSFLDEKLVCQKKVLKHRGSQLNNIRMISFHIIDGKGK
jgi:hypothetical protein